MTALQTIPKAAVEGAIKIARLPADALVGVAPETRITSAIGTAVDRADARVRSAAGNALRDTELQREAGLLRSAVDERRRTREPRTESRERARRASAQDIESPRAGREAPPHRGPERGEEASRGAQAPRAGAGRGAEGGGHRGRAGRSEGGGHRGRAGRVRGRRPPIPSRSRRLPSAPRWSAGRRTRSSSAGAAPRALAVEGRDRGHQVGFVVIAQIATR